MTKQDILGNQVKSIYLGIGSNLGLKKNNIEKAKYKLIESGIVILNTSNFYETLSWPDSNKPKFLNIVIKINTNLTYLELLEKCKEIEAELGRKKTKKNYPRTCDIDILDYNKKCINQNITLPHSRMHKRNFVLLPLFEIDKDWEHPISKKHIKSLILLLRNRDIRSIKQI